MKKDGKKTLFFALLSLAVLAIWLGVGITTAQGADTPGYDGGYPPPMTGTPTLDPWCEEMRLLGKNLPWWCLPVVATPEGYGYPAPAMAESEQPSETPQQIMMRRSGMVKKGGKK